MSSAGRQTAVGAFVLGGGGLALAAVLLFGKLHIFSPVKQAAVVFQDSIAGLSIGSPVTFRGVRVGAVQNIAIQFDQKTHVAYIPVVVQLDAGRVLVAGNGHREAVDLEGLIARGLRAELNTQSFVTGQSEIDLDFDNSSAAVLHPDITELTEIPTKQSAIQRVKETLSQLPLRELVDNASVTLESLRGLSEKLNRGLPPLVDSLKAASDRADTLVNAAVDTLKDLQARLDVTLGNIDRLANTGGIELTGRGAERANIDSALRDIAAAAAALRGFANDVEHNPQLLLTGRKP